MSMGTWELDLLVSVTDKSDLRDHFSLWDALLGCRAGVGQEVSKSSGILSFGECEVGRAALGKAVIFSKGHGRSRRAKLLHIQGEENLPAVFCAGS